VSSIDRSNELARSGLAALGSPWGIAAVALLILNDHLLKQVAPSALTDKLGDFAGLFFAPYVLLLAVGSLPIRFSRLFERHVALVAYALVGVFFAALKVSATSAAVLTSLLTVVLAGPVSIVLDPTDLIALAVLPVSYGVWIRGQSHVASGIALRLRHATVATCAVLAMVATSQPQPWVTSAAADSIDPETMYAVLDYTVADGLHRTTDGGRTWTRLSTISGEVVADPARQGVYVLKSDPWDPRVLRWDEVARMPVDIGPPSPGKRPQTIYVDGPVILLPVPWSADLVLLAKNGDLLRTADGGRTWQSYGFVGSVRALTYASGPRVIYLATDDALLRSSDGDRWTDVATLPGRPAAIAASANGDVLLVAIGKELLRSGDRGKTWQTVLRYAGAGEASLARWQVVFDPHDPSRVYLLYGRGCCAAMFSVNGGMSWREWGEPIADLTVGATRDHPLIAITSRLKSVLRHDGDVPGTWADVGAALPVRR
jgi:photosystem II stability/assembly factor-like uncharacterized protein